MPPRMPSRKSVSIPEPLTKADVDEYIVNRDGVKIVVNGHVISFDIDLVGELAKRWQKANPDYGFHALYTSFV